MPELGFGDNQESREPLTANTELHVRASRYLEEGCDPVGSPGRSCGPMESGAYAGAGFWQDL